MEFFHVDVGKEDHSDIDETKDSFFLLFLSLLSLALSLSPYFSPSLSPSFPFSVSLLPPLFLSSTNLKNKPRKFKRLDTMLSIMINRLVLEEFSKAKVADANGIQQALILDLKLHHGFNSNNLRRNLILEIYMEEADHPTIYWCGLLFNILMQIKSVLE